MILKYKKYLHERKLYELKDDRYIRNKKKA